MVVAHNIIDGRNAFILMDIFLSYIAKQLENTAEYISDLKWGDEVHHLTPPSPFIKTIVESGTPPELTKAHAHSIKNKQKLASETMQQLVCFFSSLLFLTSINASFLEAMDLQADKVRREQRYW